MDAQGQDLDLYNECKGAPVLFILIKGVLEVNSISHGTGVQNGFICAPHSLINPEVVYLGEVKSQTYSLKSGGRVFRIPLEFYLELEDHHPDLFKGLICPWHWQGGGQNDSKEPESSFLHGFKEAPQPAIQIHDMDFKKDLSKDVEIGQEILGYALSFLVPLITYFTLGKTSLLPEGQLFISFLTGSMTLWFFNIVPQFIIALLLLSATLTIGVVPPEVMLKGFTSDGFIVLLGAYAISNTLMLSGLGHRFVLKFLKRLGKTYQNTTHILFVAGGILTLFMPSILPRMEVVSTIYREAYQAQNLDHHPRAALHLAITVFYGATLFSSVFLSGSIFNYFILSLFPSTIKQQFSWFTWLEATSIYGCVMLGGFYLLQTRARADIKVPPISVLRLLDQLKVMGHLDGRQWVTAFATGIFMLGVLTQGLHDIKVAWIALYSLFLIFFLNILSPKELKSRFDWPFLIMLSTTLGIAEVIEYLEINNYLIDFIKASAGTPHLPNYALLFLVFVIGLFLSNVLPLAPALILGSSICIPLTNSHHIHPFVTGFLILLSSEFWGRYHPSPLFGVFCKQIKWGGKKPFENPDFFRFQHQLNWVRMLALAASIPLWVHMGLL